jgi:molecular chaperone GrpE
MRFINRHLYRHAMTEPSDPMAGTPEPAFAADEETARLRAQLAEAEAKALASRDAHLRALADLENIRKRAEREIAAGAKYGAEKLLGQLLGIADSLDLGLSAADKPDVQVPALLEGMRLTRKQLADVLEKNGVTVVDPAGQPFNPELHEAVTALESPDVPPNHVMSVMQKGYRLHERLLRPAMVVVAKAPTG